MKESFAVSSLILVEGKTDKVFIEAYIQHLNLNLNVAVDSPVCSADSCEILGGKDELEQKLNSLVRTVRKEGVDKVGIIIDANSAGIESRTKEVQDKIDLVFGEDPSIDFLIYILNIDGFGELETILKAIKLKNSIYADCLNAFQDCLPDGKKLTEKELLKRWVYYYQVYDNCSSSDRKQSGRKCSDEASMKKSIYDFDHAVLDGLKDFLIKL